MRVGNTEPQTAVLVPLRFQNWNQTSLIAITRINTGHSRFDRGRKEQKIGSTSSTKVPPIFWIVEPALPSKLLGLVIVVPLVPLFIKKIIRARNSVRLYIPYWVLLTTPLLWYHAHTHAHYKNASKIVELVEPDALATAKTAPTLGTSRFHYLRSTWNRSGTRKWNFSVF